MAGGLVRNRVVLLAACAYSLLVRALLGLHGQDSTRATALGRDFKAKISIAIYVAAILLAFVNAWVAGVLYAVVAAMWLVPDPRIEKRLAH